MEVLVEAATKTDAEDLALLQGGSGSRGRSRHGGRWGGNQ